MAEPTFDAEGFTVTASPRRPVLHVLSDAPVGEGGNPDLLGARSAAQRLASLIRASRGSTPFTLAVDAVWGMGKSSLLHQLSDELKPDVVWFNAWTGGSASALEGLIKSVLLSADRNVVRRAVRSLAGRRHLVSGVRVAAMLASSVVGLGGVVNDIWQVLAADAKSRNEIRDVLADALQDWRADGRILTVFVDDLDRCSDHRIVEVCEAVKLYLSVPGVVFVLACDQVVLRRAAGQYLEKIVQLTYQLQPPSDEQAAQFVDDCLRRSGTVDYFDVAMRNLVIERSDRNPRRIKRLINNFVLAHHLFPEWESAGAEHLIKIILLQQFYPGFYRKIEQRPAEVTDFLTYAELRSAVKHGGKRNVPAWRRLFTEHDLRPPPSDVAATDLPGYLAGLEEQLSVDFPELAADKDFVSLVTSLTVPLESGKLGWLLRTPLSLATGGEVPDAGMELVRGLGIVWVDDDPRGNTSLLQRLTTYGARVVQVANRAELVAELSVATPDVLLSDITRFGDMNAGLDDLAYVRDERIYTGPAIFYTGNVTLARRRRAQQLGAAITDNPVDVLAEIANVAAGHLPGWRSH